MPPAWAAARLLRIWRSGGSVRRAPGAPVRAHLPLGHGTAGAKCSARRSGSSSWTPRLPRASQRTTRWRMHGCVRHNSACSNRPTSVAMPSSRIFASRCTGCSICTGRRSSLPEAACHAKGAGKPFSGRRVRGIAVVRGLSRAGRIHRASACASTACSRPNSNAHPASASSSRH